MNTNASAKLLALVLTTFVVTGDGIVLAKAHAKQKRAAHSAQKQKKEMKSDCQIKTVTYQEEGGFAYRKQSVEIHAADLKDTDLTELTAAIKDTGILNQDKTERTNPAAADVIYYSYSVLDGTKLHTARFDDTTISDSYRNLSKVIKKIKPI